MHRQSSPEWVGNSGLDSEIARARERAFEFFVEKTDAVLGKNAGVWQEGLKCHSAKKGGI